MERLFRGLIQIGGNPSHADGINNWRNFKNQGLEIEDQSDKHILKYLEDWFHEYINCGIPEYSIIKKFFEDNDEIEVVTRLEEIAKSQCYIYANYQALISSIKEKQSIKQVNLLSRDMANIAEHGMKVGKEVFKGPDAALQYFDKQRKSIYVNGASFKYRYGASIKSNTNAPIFLMKHFGIQYGRPSALVAYAGSAKTYLAIELALAVAAGHKTCWGGIELSLSGPVIHLDYEMGEDHIDHRYQRVAHGMGIDLDNLRGIEQQTPYDAIKNIPTKVQNDELLRVSSLPELWLTSPGIESVLMRECKDAALLIIDSFRAATAGSKIEENSSEMRCYIDMLTRVSSKTKCVILILHHERKGGKDSLKLQNMRGSSGLADALGSTIHADRDLEGNFSLEQGKVSASMAGDRRYFRLEDVGEQTPWGSEGIIINQGTEFTSGANQTERAIDEITQSLLTHGPAKSRIELQERGVKLRCTEFGRTKQIMIERGLLKDTKGFELVISAEELIGS